MHWEWILIKKDIEVITKRNNFFIILERVRKFHIASKSILQISIEILARIKNDLAL